MITTKINERKFIIKKKNYANFTNLNSDPFLANHWMTQQCKI